MEFETITTTLSALGVRGKGGGVTLAVCITMDTIHGDTDSQSNKETVI